MVTDFSFSNSNYPSLHAHTGFSSTSTRVHLRKTICNLMPSLRLEMNARMNAKLAIAAASKVRAAISHGYFTRASTRSAAKITDLFAAKRALPLPMFANGPVNSVSPQASATIKDYLQGRMLAQRKCSIAKLIKNKENLSEMKCSSSAQFLTAKN